MMDEKELVEKGILEFKNKEDNRTEEDLIREVAEEEGMTYEEVMDMWETFKTQAKDKIKIKNRNTKPKRLGRKVIAKNKASKKARKKNQ